MNQAHHAIALYTLLFLCGHGCGTIPDDPLPARISASHAVNPAPDTFEQTEKWNTGEIEAAAAARIQSERPLSTEEAERCWKKEQKRTEAREACLLAWAAGEASSALLEGALINDAPSSRPLALAAVRRESVFRTIPLAQALKILQPLAGDPSWVRARALAAWLAAHPEAGERERIWIWNAVGFDAGAAGPASLHSAWGLAAHLDAAREEEVIGHFCGNEEPPMAQVRCLRALSALVDPKTGLPAAALEPRLMKRSAEAWALFEVFFPERGLLLKQKRR
jgi:hypothetical protein